MSKYKWYRRIRGGFWYLSWSKDGMRRVWKRVHDESRGNDVVESFIDQIKTMTDYEDYDTGLAGGVISD